MTASTRRELRSAATSTSTTAIGLIRALTDARPIKPTSTRCLSARRPNPGRGSTYRRGNSVQTTAATSEPQNLLEHLPCDGDPGHLEDNIAAVAHGLRADLDQLVLQVSWSRTALAANVWHDSRVHLIAPLPSLIHCSHVPRCCRKQRRARPGGSCSSR